MALESDTTPVFTALAIQQVALEVEVIARANDAESVPKLYRAGAGYVLALSTVPGRMLASHLLDEDVLRPESLVQPVRVTAPNLGGRTLADADVRADTVAREDDTLVIAGTDEAVARFNGRLA